MYKRILIPIAPEHYDKYSGAFEVARTLLAPGGVVSILSVIEDIPAYVDNYVPDDLVKKNMAEVASALKARFSEVGTKTFVVSGHSANTILAWAKQNQVDCIVILSHQPGLSDYFIGSTAARVVRHATCAVHVLR